MPTLEQTVERPMINGPSPAGFAMWRGWLMVVLVGIVTGVSSWLVGEGVLRAYRPVLFPAMKPIPTSEDTRLLVEARIASGTAVFAAMGGLFGLVGGLAGRSASRPMWRAVRAGGVGLFLGAIGVAAVARLILPIIFRNLDPQASDLLLPLLGHEAIWSVAGALGGLAFGFGSGPRSSWANKAFGGLLGAALATVVYELVGALGFPSHRTHLPLAGSPETRALAQILVATGAAIGAFKITDGTKANVLLPNETSTGSP